jgi:hypothetical protein
MKHLARGPQNEPIICESEFEAREFEACLAEIRKRPVDSSAAVTGTDRDPLAQQFAAQKGTTYTPGFCSLCGQPFPESCSVDPDIGGIDDEDDEEDQDDKS